ncbi:alpha/beta fold hydrolase [Aquabacterium sp.]|uniref:alpha/beta fold hydrolase n=1 Tax=Aquabacterium sp. TaxID=1872578 RepID=UPI003D6D36FD
MAQHHPLPGRFGRCIAPDLIGMGDSEKLPDSGSTSYTFAEHSKYLHRFFESIDIDGPLTLVVHDWGSDCEPISSARRHSRSAWSCAPAIA